MADIRLKRITVEQNQAPLNISNGKVVIEDTTLSNSAIDGALVVNGGIGIKSTSEAASATSGGALTVGGGIGIMKSLVVGKDIIQENTNNVLSIAGVSTNRLFLDNVSNKNFYISVDGVNKRFDLQDTTLSLNITSESTNSSTGALVVQGGVSINSSANNVGSTSGGALTVAGGVAIGKDLSVAMEIHCGAQNSQNSGLTIRYTDGDQLVLNGQTPNKSGIIAMNGDNMNVMNDDDIELTTSAGNIIFSNASSGNVMMRILPDSTEFDQGIVVGDTTVSSNISTGSVVFLGGQSISCTQDVTSASSGGALTVGGGVGVVKNAMVGQAVGINVLGSSVSNKLVLFQTSGSLSETHEFSGIGSENGGSLKYQVDDTTSDHIFYSATSSTTSEELFRVKGNGDVIIQGQDQPYKITGGGNLSSSLSFQGNASAAPSSINFYTSDGDGNDNNDLRVYGVGLPTNVVNSEYLKVGWDTTLGSYSIAAQNSGTGQKRELVIGSSMNNQLVLATNGSTILNGTGPSNGGNTGALRVVGGVTIQNTENSQSWTSGGALTVAGGVSIGKDGYIGEELVIGAATPHYYNINTTVDGTSDEYGVIALQSVTSKNPKLVVQGDNVGVYDAAFEMYTLGQMGESDIERIEIVSVGSDHYTLRSVSDGSGQSRFIVLEASGVTSGQFVLQTSGNIGIHTITPSYTLDVNGTLGVMGDARFSSTQTSTSVTSASIVLQGGLSISSTADATSETRGGTITTLGGASIGKNLYVGGVAKFTSTIPSTSYNSGAVLVQGGLTVQCAENVSNIGNGGALTVQGGASIGGDLWVGGEINGSGSSSSTFAYLTLTATDEAINFTTGALITFGGITIQCTTNATSVTDGGSFLVQGGGAFGGDLIIGQNQFVNGLVNIYNINQSECIRLIDELEVKRFSIDLDQISKDYIVTRYDSNATVLDESIRISSNTGVVTIGNTTSSSSSSDAAFVVKGGVSVSCTENTSGLANGGALTVAGGVSIGKGANIGGSMVIHSTTQSNDTSTGALIVAGGVGVGGNLNVQGSTIINGDLTVNGQTTSLVTTNTIVEDNVLTFNAGPSGSRNAGYVIQRFQTDNDFGSGDVVNETIGYERFDNLPDQTGVASDAVKLSASASSVNDFYVGWWVKLASGFSSNQTRKIIAYDGAQRLATLSSTWTSQNPSIGDTIYMYNRPFVGIMFNEVLDRLELGATTDDPSTQSVNLKSYIPCVAGSLLINSTTSSVNRSSGSIVVNGGVGISSTEDAVSSTNGGGLTVGGGGAIAKSLYVGNDLYISGVKMTPNSQDIFATRTFSANNGQIVAANITDFAFNNTVWGFDGYLCARFESTNVGENKYANFYLRGVNKGTTWELVQTYVGDDMGLQFDVDTNGQVRYTSPTYPNFVGLTFKWRALTN